MAEKRPIKLSIAALGGQGGGVLTDWLIGVAETNHYLVQSTSVPGVAQRTGATIYYLEFHPRAEADRVGREPIMALMPVPGDVDCVIASELAEAGRAIQRGLVGANTTLIASTHRAYAIAEKSALGDRAPRTTELLELIRSKVSRSILFDMEATADRHNSVISAVLLGAIAGSGLLPFDKSSFASAIEQSGVAVKTNLAAYHDAYAQVRQGGEPAAAAAPAKALPEKARSPNLQPLLERIRRLPMPAQMTAFEGARRTLDYQDVAYAEFYLTRVEKLSDLERHAPPGRAGTLTEASARSLALWMTFEDTLRVAQLKTRSERFARVREEMRPIPGQILSITEFMKPRVEEIAGTLPAGIGRKLLASAVARRRLERWTSGRHIHTTSLGGFMLLYILGGLRRWRRKTLRYQEENGRIENWLSSILRLASINYSVAVEIARAQRLVKGYGETHERGWRNFCGVMSLAETAAERRDGDAILMRLTDAALSDEEGIAFARELKAINSTVGDLHG